jgi:hypothetical protein
MRAALVLLGVAMLASSRGAAAQSLDAWSPRASEDKAGFESVWSPSYAYGMYVGGASVTLEPEARAQAGIGATTGVLFGFNGTLFRFAHVDAGFGLAWAEDRAGFVELECSEQDPSDCRATGSGVTNDTSVMGFLYWLKLGPQLRWLVPIESAALDFGVRASFGAQVWDMTRSANEGSGCTTCAEQTIDLGGLYVSPEIDLGYAWGSKKSAASLGLKLSYERFVTGDLVDGMRLSAFVASYL